MANVPLFNRAHSGQTRHLGHAIADAKTRSKWSRVLRYARKAKPADQRLTDFIKSQGGLNACARRDMIAEAKLAKANGPEIAQR